MTINLTESGYLVLTGTSALARGPFEKQRREETSIHHKGDPRTAELLFRITMSVNKLRIYEAVSVCREELAQQISDPSSSITRKLGAELNDESESKVAATVVSISTNPPLVNAPVLGDLLRRHNERFEKPSRGRSSEQSWRRRWFYEKGFSWAIFCDNSRHSIDRIRMCWFMARIHVRHFELMKDPPRKDGSKGTQKLVLYWKSKLRITCITMELKYGSQSWIVISRGMNKYVTELLEEGGQSIHDEEAALGAEKTRCDKTTGTSHTSFIFIFDDSYVDRATEME